MLGEDVGDKRICNTDGSDCIRSWNKDTSLRKAVYIHQDSREPTGRGYAFGYELLAVRAHAESDVVAS